MEADGRAASPVAQWLAGGMVLFTATLTSLGVGAGTVERIMRNEPWWFLGFFVLIIAAIGLGVIAPVLSDRVPETMLIPGVVALLLGLAGFGELAVLSAGDTQRPQVSAGVLDDDKGRLVIKGEAKLSGLRSRDYALVRIDALAPPARPGKQLAKFHFGPGREVPGPLPPDPTNPATTDGAHGPFQTVWSGRSGPAPDGTVTVPIHAEIPKGRFESVVVSAFHQNSSTRFGARRRCTAADRGWGCVEIMLPGASAAAERQLPTPEAQRP